MKLYYSPGACSLAPHIVAAEAGISLELVRVDIPSKTTAAGDDFRQINPKGYVPALMLDDGQVVTEVAVICQYLADQKPESGLMAQFGSMERYRQMSALNFVATEIHKQIGALFNPQLTAEMKTVQQGTIARRLNSLDDMLGEHRFVAGDKFTAADAYLFTALSWSRFHDLDMEKWPNIRAYMAHMADRAAVQEAMRAEGLVK